MKLTKKQYNYLVKQVFNRYLKLHESLSRTGSAVDFFAPAYAGTELPESPLSRFNTEANPVWAAGAWTVVSVAVSYDRGEFVHAVIATKVGKKITLTEVDYLTRTGYNNNYVYGIEVFRDDTYSTSLNDLVANNITLEDTGVDE